MPEIRQAIFDSLKEQIIDLLMEELFPLLETQKTLKEFRERLNAIAVGVEIGGLADALRYSYISSMVMAIGRQTDKDVRVLSLSSFLDALLRHADYFTHDWYIAKFSKVDENGVEWHSAGGGYEVKALPTEFHLHQSSEMEYAIHYEQADGTEYGFFDKGGRLDMHMLRSDIESLETTTKLIRRYRDKFIAHGERGAVLKVQPNFNDLDAAIETIRTLIVKYYLLITQNFIDTSLSHVHTDWDALLKKKELQSE